MEVLVYLALFAGFVVPGLALLRRGLRRPVYDPMQTSSPPGSGTMATIGGITLVGMGGFAIFVAHAFFHFDLGMSSKGRILRLRGKARLPTLVPGGGWTDGMEPRVEGLGEQERRVLAVGWAESGRMEHASVAAFSQLGLHLVALGAPSELVERTHRAALDEIRHARRCFALAGAFAGAEVAAGPIAELASARDGGIDHIRLAVGSLVDGALAEGIAADVAAAASRTASDPTVRASLAMIAGDEAQHAELAWAVLAWCLEVGGDGVRAAVAARAARLGDELAPTVPDYAGIPAERLAAHGLLDQEAIGQLASRRIAAVKARAEGMTVVARAAA